MKTFINDNFMLNNEAAVKLYHEYAKNMPIFDYHCHLNTREIAENKRYKNITELWLNGDHYKWRAMRSNGVEEKYITEEASDKEKFIKWAETVPFCIGNPLYHWTHLELKRYFGIDKLLSPETAEEIWERCNGMLQGEEFTARKLITQSNVKFICTSDDPADSLEYHIALAEDKSFDVKVLPTFRPDEVFHVGTEGFVEWIEKISKVVDVKIETFNDLECALEQRIKFFHGIGCRISDQSLEPVVFEESTYEEADNIFKKALKRECVSLQEAQKYKTRLMVFLGKQYAEMGWAMQLHIGAIRNVNTRKMRLLGANTGFDSIGDFIFVDALAKFLSELDDSGKLPKTILYCLNPRDNDAVGAIAGCFQEEGMPGKIQFGSGWWFNDQKDGMIKQMVALANTGLLSRFVGMLTDSRSFLSYTRHEYFRRILCNLLGEWAESGEVPDDMELLGQMIENICFNNAKNYFNV